MSFCAKTVRSSARRIDDDNDELLEIGLTMLDPMTIIDDVHVRFSHQPGNKSLDEAHEEMRKRGSFVDLDKNLRVEAFNWNYNAAQNTAKSKNFSMASIYSFSALCVECYSAYEASFDFEIIISRPWYGLPRLEYFKLVYTGTHNSADVMRIVVRVDLYISQSFFISFLT